jgi:hypothetical protein
MSTDILIGVGLLIGIVGISIYLIFWSTHFINKIERKGPDTARKILKNIHD